MDEPPGTRLRVALSALTMAEYFRDVQKQDVLLFIDNIFRFTQAGSEVSTLLGRMPSAVGYQPTLADEMGQLQERITSTRGHSITSMQAIYVPADDITDPAPHTTFAHLDATTVLSRPISEKGIYPAVDPLDSTSRILDAEYIGQEHYDVAAADQADPAALQGAAGHHRDPRYRRALRRGQGHRRPGPADRAVPVAEHVRRRAVHRHPRLVRAGRGDDRRVQAAVCRRVRRATRSRRSSCAAASRTSSARPHELKDDEYPMATMQVELVSIEAAIWSGEASAVYGRTIDGELGILPGPHAAARRARARAIRCASSRRAVRNCASRCTAGSSRSARTACRCSPSRPRWPTTSTSPRARDALNRADRDDDGDAQAARDRALARLRAAGEQV